MLSWDVPPDTFGERLKKSREAMGLSQLKLAQALGVSHVTVYNWEAGERDPSRLNIIKAAKVLKVRAGWLLDGEGEDGFSGQTDSLKKGTEAEGAEKPGGLEQQLSQRIDQLERREEEARERHEEMMAVLLRIAERLGDTTRAGGRPQLLEPPGRPGRTGEGRGA